MGRVPSAVLEPGVAQKDWFRGLRSAREFRNACGDGHRTNTNSVTHGTVKAWALDPTAWVSIPAPQLTNPETSGKLLHFWASGSPSVKWYVIRLSRGLDVSVSVKKRICHIVHRMKVFNIPASLRA